MKLMFGLKVAGSKNVPKRGAFILAANHSSYLDPPAVGVACPRKVHFMARHDLFQVPVLGQWMVSVGAFAVKRGSADISAMKEAIRCLKKGDGLVLFPQGRRSGIEKLQEDIQAGIGFIAQKSCAPVIPVLVKGTEKALPKNSKFIRRAQVTVRFGEAIQIGKDTSYQEAAALIASGIKKLSTL